MTTPADISTRLTKGLVITLASLDRGGRVITSGSTGSTPNDWAGGPSIKISELLVSIPFSSEICLNPLTNPQYLHRIEGILKAEETADKDQR